MRILRAALTATTIVAAITLLTGCSKGTSNNTNASTTNASASPAATATQPSSTPSVSNSGASTPTAAFAAYYEAVKRKDATAVMNLFSKGTRSMMEERAKRENTTLDDVMKKGLEEAGEEIPANVPETRNEKIDGDKATLEAKDEKKDKWETLRFVREDGQWKIAFDERE